MKLNVNSSKILPYVFWVILVFIIIVDVSLYKPLMDDIHKTSQEQKKVFKDTMFATSLLDVQSKANLRPLVSEEKLDDVFYSVSDLAEKQGLRAKLNTKNILTEMGGSKDLPYLEKTVGIDLTGSLTKLGSFVLALKGFPDAIININSVNVNPSIENSGDVQAQLNLTVLTAKQ